MPTIVTNARLWLHAFEGSVLDTLKRRRLQLFGVRGLVKNTRTNASVIYCGEPSAYRSWSPASLFSECSPPQPLEGISLGAAMMTRSDSFKEFDLALCPANPLTGSLFSRFGWFLVPRYVECVIDLRKPLETLLSSRGVKKEVGTFKKANYSFSVKQTVQDFEFFYERMLRPTVDARHGERGYVSGLNALLSEKSRGYLLAAHQETKWVGADFVVRETPSLLRWGTVGWLDGDARHLKEGVVSALLYELVKRAKGEGFLQLHLGSCNPFLDDGSLTYKLKWGADIHLPSIEFNAGKLEGLHSYLAAHLNLERESAQELLHQSPFIGKFEGKPTILTWGLSETASIQRYLDAGMGLNDLATSHRKRHIGESGALTL